MSHLLRQGIWVSLIALLISGCGGLGGDPQIVTTIDPATRRSTPTPSPQPEIGFPQQSPNLVTGRALYLAQCTACHGVQGAGNGELAVTGQLVLDGVEQNPGNFQDTAAVAAQTPLDWYNTITNGRIENLMPPWRDAFTEAQRWDVSLYTYVIRYTPEQISRGESLFTDDIAAALPDLTDQQTMVNTSDDALLATVTEITPDLSEDDGRAIVAYARTQSLDNVAVALDTTTPTTAQDVTTEPPTAVSEAVTTIVGEVSNGTADSDVPSNTEVSLIAFDALTTDGIPDVIATTVTNDNNIYTFEDITINPNRIYLVTTAYNGREFASQVPTNVNLLSDRTELPLVIYEITDDPSAISILASVSQLTLVGNTIEVQQVVQFQNNSDRVYISGELDDGRIRSVEIELPPGAIVIPLDETRANTVYDEATRTIYDTRGITPGATRLLQVAYLLEYPGEATIQYAVPFTLTGDVRVLVQPLSVRLESEQLASLGEETVGSTLFNAYGERLALPADSLITYTLRGEAPEAAVIQTQPESDGSSSGLAAVLVVIGGVMVLLSAIIFGISRRGSTSKRGNNALIDGLVSQIAELDAEHERGEINHDIYQQRRAQLKARLTELMDSQPKS